MQRKTYEIKTPLSIPLSHRSSAMCDYLQFLYQYTLLEALLDIETRAITCYVDGKYDHTEDFTQKERMFLLKYHLMEE